MKRRRRAGFTLTELIVAMGLLMVILAFFAGVMSMVAGLWETSHARSDSLRQARQALDVMTRRLGAVTLDARPELYQVNRFNKFPARPGQIAPGQVFPAEHSDLHFICGPAASLLPADDILRPTHAAFFVGARGGDLAVEGFAVEYGPDRSAPAFARDLVPPDALRLVHYQLPGEALERMRGSLVDQWLQAFFGADATFSAGPVELARGIVALVFRPEAWPGDVELAPAYRFDSRAWHRGRNDPAADPQRNRLPPTLGVTLVVLNPDAEKRVSAAGPEAVAALTEGLFVEAAAHDADVDEVLRRARDWGGARAYQSRVMLHGNGAP